MTKIYSNKAVTDFVNPVDTSSAHKAMSNVQQTLENKSTAYIKQAKTLEKEAQKQQDQAIKEQEKQQAQALTTFKNNLSTSNKIAVQGLYREHMGNPKELQEAYQEMNDNLAGQIEDPALRESVLLDNILHQQTYIYKAEDEFKKTQIKESKISHEGNITSNLETIKEQASIFFSPYYSESENARRTLVQNSFNSIVDSVNAINPDGTPVFTEKQKIAYQNDLNMAKIGGYKTQLDELYQANTIKAQEFMSYIDQNPQEVMKKFSLDRKEYDQLRSYNTTVQRVFKELDDKVNPETGVSYTEQEMSNIANLTDSTLFKYNQIKEGTLGDFDSMVDLRRQMTVLDGINNKALTKSQKQKIMSETASRMYKYISDNTDAWGRDNATNRLADLVTKDLKADDYDRVNVFEMAYTNLVKDGKDVKSTDSQVIKQMEDYYKQAKEQYFKKTYPQSYGSNATMIFDGTSIQTFTEKGDNNIGVNIDLDGGYKLERMDGRLYRVSRDKDGNVIHMVLEL